MEINNSYLHTWNSSLQYRLAQLRMFIAGLLPQSDTPDYKEGFAHAKLQMNNLLPQLFAVEKVREDTWQIVDHGDPRRSVLDMAESVLRVKIQVQTLMEFSPVPTGYGRSTPFHCGYSEAVQTIHGAARCAFHDILET